MDIQAKEAQFHDQWAKSINPKEVLVRESFESSTTPEGHTIIEWMGDIKGKKVLDLGSGAGESAVYFALQGAHVTASDISPEMLEVVKKVGQLHGVEVDTLVTSADRIPVADSTFDIVHAANLLHHVDVFKTIEEVKRVLKPGGKFLSWDPLDHNPAINVYRRIATEVRTEDEHPLKFKEVKALKKYFPQVKFECYWFFTLLIFIKFYFWDRIDPNKERYWKKIVLDHKKLGPTYRILRKMDDLFLSIFPFMKRFCWNIVICCQK